MTELPYDREDHCYRHPDRQSYILCQRCGRTICPSCQTQAAVGVHCPECVQEARQNAPKRPPVNIRAARALRSNSDKPLATYTVLGLMGVVYLATLIVPSLLTAVAFIPIAAGAQPWTLVTYPLAHASPISLLINALIMFLIGRQAEQMLGRNRFIALFLLSALGGAVAILLFVPGGVLLGTSPVIWGFFGVVLVYSRSQGANVTGLLVMLGLFLVIGLVVGSAWQATVGGFIVGAAVTAVSLRFSAIRQQRQRMLAIGAIALALIVVAAVAILT